MTDLQNDILEIYNSLVMFSDGTVKSNIPIPITVHFEKESNSLVLEQRGKSARLRIPIYYSLGLDEIVKPTYLLPEDYDYLMSTMQSLIGSGDLIKSRVCVSPENYGFDVYLTNLKEFQKGPQIIGQCRFISGTSWLFKYMTKRKYKL